MPSNLKERSQNKFLDEMNIVHIHLGF